MPEPECIDLLRRRQSEGMELLLRHYGPLMKYITERAVEGKLYRARQRLRKALGGGDGHA